MPNRDIEPKTDYIPKFGTVSGLKFNTRLFCMGCKRSKVRILSPRPEKTSHDLCDVFVLSWLEGLMVKYLYADRIVTIEITEMEFFTKLTMLGIEFPLRN